VSKKPILKENYKKIYMDIFDDLAKKKNIPPGSNFE